MSTQLIIFMGPGGVGKTSLSAALALRLAQEGHKVAVITVDPARRLGQVLGLKTLSNDPQKVSGLNLSGELWALWLDPKNFLRILVKKYSNKHGARLEHLVEHRLFKIIEEQLGGVEEYLGVERLVHLADSNEYDFVILDTPPLRHALDFLDSPQHLLRFFDESILQFFLKTPSKEQGGFFHNFLKSISIPRALDIFSNFLGNRFLGELSELLNQMKPVYEVFKHTANTLEKWTSDPKTKFVIVGSLETSRLDEMRILSLELERRQLRLPDLAILNQSLPHVAPADWNVISHHLGADSCKLLEKQFELQCMMRKQWSTDNILSQLVTLELSRLATPLLSLEELQILGERMIQQWRSLEANLFLNS